jgi:phosphoglycerate dehydrogenase-like enzyme
VPLELWKLDNVILNPHNGGATYAARARGLPRSRAAS